MCSLAVGCFKLSVKAYQMTTDRVGYIIIIIIINTKKSRLEDSNFNDEEKTKSDYLFIYLLRKTAKDRIDWWRRHIRK